jgi:hypothetical protein
VSALGPIVAALVPVVVVVALIRLVERLGRARRDAAERQVAVTDAIHRDLGAIVAPTVQTRLWGAWQVLIPVPFERPDAVERVVAIAHATLAGLDPARADRVRIVLVPQPRFTRYIPAATKTIASARACVTGSPSRSAPASMPKIGVPKENAASGAAG